MRVFRDRKFHSSPLLIELFALRAAGMTLDALAERYKRHESSLVHHLRKHKISPMFVEVWHPKGVKRKRRVIIIEERVNPGKSYAEYLKESRARRWR